MTQPDSFPAKYSENTVQSPVTQSNVAWYCIHQNSEKDWATIQFPDDNFKGIFLNENVWIVIEISLKFVPKCPINNIPALV